MPSTLAIRLTAAGQRHLRSGHPWIYSDSIERVKGEDAPGDIAIVFDRRTDRVIGVGLYDPNSPIRIKVLHAGGGARIDASFWRKRVEDAYTKRASLRATDTNSYRLVHGENDQLPGLVADVYAEVLVVKVYSLMWAPFLAKLLDLLLEHSACHVAVLRLSRNVQQHPACPSAWRDGAVVRGHLDHPVVVFREHGVRLSADVVHGHKTGFFLDHRHNRQRLGAKARGKSVLDIFSYAGGFSVHALVGGARHVTALDISAQALETARTNAELNLSDPPFETLAGDAFAELEQLHQQGRTFDIVIVDPPSFAKRASEVAGALRAYERLTLLALPLVAKRGTLLLASCSARVGTDDFYHTQTQLLDRCGRRWTELERVGHDVDHPVGFPEGRYLKGLWVQLDVAQTR